MMKADSSVTVDASNDPRQAELCLMVVFAVEDYEVRSSSQPPAHHM